MSNYPHINMVIDNWFQLPVIINKIEIFIDIQTL